MSKIIFLDIDGVLNCETDFMNDVYNYNPVHSKLQKGEGWKVINAGMLAILNDIVKQTGANIVLSTTWRNKCDAKKLTKIFQRYGNIWQHPADVIIGQTVDMQAGNGYSIGIPSYVTQNEIREAEIDLWMAENQEPESFVVIDDMKMNYDNMIHTDQYVGLTRLLGWKAMLMLGRLPKYQRKFEVEQQLLYSGIFN